MPRTAPTFHSFTAEEQRLIRHFSGPDAMGAIDKLAGAARKSKLPLDKARKILTRVSVQEEVARRIAVVRGEQARLQAEDLEHARRAKLRRGEVTKQHAHVALHELLEINPREKAPGGEVKLRAARLALVVAGEIRDGRTERVAPAQTGVSQYRSMFGGRSAWQGVEAAPIDGTGDESGAATTPTAEIERYDPAAEGKQVAAEMRAKPEPEPDPPPRPATAKQVAQQRADDATRRFREAKAAAGPNQSGRATLQVPVKR